MRISTIVSALSFFLFLAVPSAAPVRAGEGDTAQPYKKISYPDFANGRLLSLLEADTADVFDLTVGTPRINMKNVVITLYDHTNLGDLPPDRPPPVKMIITSDTGFFTRRPPEPGAAPEEIANLEGNVVLRQMRVGSDSHKSERRPQGRASRLEPGVETEIRCEHAIWNNTQRKLNGDGEVWFLQEDSSITGTDFLYLAGEEALESGAGSANIKDWGGIIFIEHNARMEIERAGDADGASGKTVITCRDTASYKLVEREIQFERDVKVQRRDLTIESDILKVFLRRNDEPVPEPMADADGSAMPGQVKSIIATIGKRPGSVIITGYKQDESGNNAVQFTAKGGRADFDYDANRINLTDMREQRLPSVEFGSDGNRITDGLLTFIFSSAPAPGAGADTAAEHRAETVLDSLATSGGNGEVVLRSSNPDARDSAALPAVPTIVVYRGDMSYNRLGGRILFRDKVQLRRSDLEIRSEILDIRLIADGDSPEPTQVNRILAETDVEIVSGEYQAKAQRAEYDVYQDKGRTPENASQTARLESGGGLDTLRLFGPPQGTPPHPWIRDGEGNQISAPEIHMQRLSAGVPGQRDQHLLVARGGVSVCDFVADGDREDAKRKVVNIKCERGMEYNQANKKARFEGQVVAVSDNPEDNYVLTADRLLVDFEESPDPAREGEYVSWIRRITAEGNSRLTQDNRVCEAINIIRDFPINNPKAGDIYLQGTPAKSGQPPVMATYSEEIGGTIGSRFAAPLIKASSQGDAVQANGPGELSMPDPYPDNANARAQITFAGAASYEALAGGKASDARFWGGVTMTQPSRQVVITAEELDARFIQDESPTGFGGQADKVELEEIGRLRRVEGRNNVVVKNRTPKGGHRTAAGDVGIVEFTGSGNIIRLTSDKRSGKRGFVIVQDEDGLTLRSPEVEVREAQGVTRASGPGDLQMPAARNGEGMSRVPTRVVYGPNGSMVYNEVALNIRVNDRVRVVQPGVGNNWSHPSLDGICDRLDISLMEPPVAGMSGDDSLSRIRRMDAIGSVVLRVFADPPPENPNINWLNRPGTTFFTRGDQAVYDVPSGDIAIFCLDDRRQPQLLLNTVESGKPPQRQRMKADRFVLQTHKRPRNYTFSGNLDVSTIREGEAFDFAN